jgi:TRAP-type mannitol/chloroaromatic compound transport system permease large subunit
MPPMTPPFGATPLYMRGNVPPRVTMGDVNSGVDPFAALQVVGLMLCIYNPGISFKLPRLAGFLE